MLPSLVRAGLVLANKYRLVDSIGRGGMGQVWRARDSVLGAAIAVKVIDPELLETDDTRQEVFARFLREAQAAAALRSPHVVQILEFGVDDVLFDPTRPKARVPFIAMELLEGETLAARLGRTPILPYRDTAWILAHVGRAMTKAHEEGIIHRDLKPENVFLTRNDDEELAKVMDFGIAKRLPGALSDGGADVTRTGRIVGTPAYMSPEQTVGTRPIDARSDLWSMGVIAFECVCGRRPFDGATHGELTLQICAHPMPVPSKFAEVPPGFDAWFAKATARDAEKRFQSARELVDALRKVLSQPGLHEPAPPARPSAPTLDTQPGLTTTRVIVQKRARTGRVLLGLALGIIAGAGVLGALVWRDQVHRRQATAVPAETAPPAATEAPPAPPAAATLSADPDPPHPAETTAEVPPSAEPTASAEPPAAEPTVPGKPGRTKRPGSSLPGRPVRRGADPDGPSKDPRLGF